MIVPVLNVNVKFAHESPEKSYCIIEIGNEIYKGIAKCSKRDIFCKDKGRKIALFKALKVSPFSKQERAIIWEEYRNMTIIPRW